MRGESREERLGGNQQELRFEHIGKPVSLLSETSGRHSGGQVWNLGARSRRNTAVWESSKMVFIARRWLRSLWEAAWMARSQAGLWGSLNNYRIIITIVAFLEASGTVPGCPFTEWSRTRWRFISRCTFLANQDPGSILAGEQEVRVIQ